MPEPESTLSVTQTDMSTITWNVSNVHASTDNQVLTSDGVSATFSDGNAAYANNASYQLTSTGGACFIEFKFDSTWYGFVGLTSSINVQTPYSLNQAANIYGLKVDATFNGVFLVEDGVTQGNKLGTSESTYIVLYDGAKVHIFRDKILVHSITKVFNADIHAGVLMYGAAPFSVSKLSVGTYDGGQLNKTSGANATFTSTTWVNNQVILTGTVDQSITSPASLLLGNEVLTIVDSVFTKPVTTQTVNIYYTNGDDGVYWFLQTFQLPPVIINKTLTSTTLTIETPKLTDVESYSLLDSSTQPLQTITSSEWTSSATTVTLQFTVTQSYTGEGFLISYANTLASLPTPLNILYPDPTLASVTASGAYDGNGNTTLSNLSVSGGSYDGVVVLNSELSSIFGTNFPMFVSNLISFGGSYVDNLTPSDIQSGGKTFVNSTTTLYLYAYTSNSHAYTFINNGLQVDLTLPPPPPATLDPQPILVTSTDTTITFVCSSVGAYNSVYITPTAPEGKQTMDSLDQVEFGNLDATLIFPSQSTPSVGSYTITQLTPDTSYTYYIIWKLDDGTNPASFQYYEQKDVQTFKLAPGTITIIDSSVSNGTVTVNYSWTGDQSDRILITNAPITVNFTTLSIEDLTQDKQGGSVKLDDVQSGTSSISFSSAGIGVEGFYLYPYNSGAAGLSFATPTQGTVSGGGGGPGDGGENNDGNGHNNMATLEFAYPGYEGTVSQTNTITILGEEGGALTKDETITVDVRLDDFKKVLQYKSNWTTSGDAVGEQPLPDVRFRPLEASTPLTTMFNKLKVKGSGPEDSSGRQWTDDAGMTKYVFGNELLKVSFTNSALDSDNLPRESIRAIAEGDIDLTAGELVTTVLSNLDTETPGLASGTKSLLEGLFEQAVSAGRVVGSDSIVGDYKLPSFEIGDTISFLVKYTFNKQRDYVLDSDVTSGNTTTGARTTFTVAGTTFDIDGANESASRQRVYEIKLRAVANP